MMYVPFPSVSDEERFTYMSPINTEAITTTPASAAAECGEAKITGLRLIALDGRPAYICKFIEPTLQVVYADDGTVLARCDKKRSGVWYSEKPTKS